MDVIGIVALISAVTFYIGKKCNIGTMELIISIIFLFPIPLSVLVGQHFPVFLSDLLPLFLILSWSKKLSVRFFSDKIVRLSLILFIIIPFLSVIFSLASFEPSDIRYYLYVYRRLLAFVIVLISSSAWRYINPYDLLKAACLFWCLISFFGLLNYLGVYPLPSYIEEKEMDIEGDVFENFQLVRGFLSYNRGALGLYGCTFLIFAFCRLYIDKSAKDSLLCKFIFLITILLSSCNILLSGTRTGAFVAVLVIFFIYMYSSYKKRKLNLSVIFLFILLVPIGSYFLSNISQNRFDQINSDDSFYGRIIVQTATFENSFENLASFLIGNGVLPFSNINPLGFVHAHSEYFDILYLGGWLSIIAYVCLILILWNSFKNTKNTPYFMLGILLSGIIFGGLIGHFMIYEPRLASYGHFIIFTYLSVYYLNLKKLTYES